MSDANCASPPEQKDLGVLPTFLFSPTDQTITSYPSPFYVQQFSTIVPTPSTIPIKSNYLYNFTFNFQTNYGTIGQYAVTVASLVQSPDPTFLSDVTVLQEIPLGYDNNNASGRGNDVCFTGQFVTQSNMYYAWRLFSRSPLSAYEIRFQLPSLMVEISKV